MTEPIDPELCECFAASVEALENDPQIEALVASILGNKHTLSAEDLAVFEEVLDDPEIDPEQRAEFFQILWNIVVSAIDYQWENASRIVTTQNCESIENLSQDRPQSGSIMLDWDANQDTQTNDKNAETPPCQKGPP